MTYEKDTKIWQKVACKMLMKLKPVVNFINILQAAFAPISLCQKITKPSSNKKKSAQSTFVQKRCS